MTSTLHTLLSIGLACALSYTILAQDKASSTSKPSSGQATKQAAEQTPKQLVEAAVLDYVDGIYKVQPERITKSVSKELTKYGFWRHDAKQGYKGTPMSYPELVKLATTYNVDHKRIPEGAAKKIEVLGLLPKIAIVKLTAAWGIDYIQLAKMDSGWKIRHVLWQSLREGSPAASDADKAAMKQAAVDYATAFYTCNPKLIEAAVHPRLAKFGFYNGKASPMDFKQLKALSATAYKGHKPKKTPKAVEILDCLDQTACVKLTGAWGIDFISLHRDGKGWKIREVIWQSHPRPVSKKKGE